MYDNDKALIIDDIVFACKTLKNMPYTASVAISELIDNSTVAIQKESIKNKTFIGCIDVTYDVTKNELSVYDNGAGFSLLGRNCTRTYGTEQPKDGRNRYNVGMKNAIFWLGNSYTIESYDTEERKMYKTGVELDVQNITCNTTPWYEVQLNEPGIRGTRIVISEVRLLASNNNIFENKIVDEIREIFRIDLENDKYRLNFFYIGHSGAIISFEDIKPSLITFQEDRKGLIFRRTKSIMIPGYNDKFNVSYQIMSKKTSGILKKSGFHFYFKGRKIITKSVEEVINDRTNIFRRSYVKINIDSSDTQLSFLKDGLSIDEKVQSTLFYELKSLFLTGVKDFFLDLSAEEKKEREKKKTENSTKKSSNEDIKTTNKNNKIDEDLYTCKFNGKEYLFRIYFDPNYRIPLKIENDEVESKDYTMYIRSDLSEENTLKTIIISTLYKDNPDFDLGDIIEKCEIL